METFLGGTKLTEADPGSFQEAVSQLKAFFLPFGTITSCQPHFATLVSNSVLIPPSTK